ncbi:PepSY-associated TM helix domain-containing protein [Sphingobacterium siyangense]|uniref:PepSY-associated TM helix domain-containing protein n=1 Tax=Sphingobacterium siyangense TaxID=459529 RepID=UPI003C7838B9
MKTITKWAFRWHGWLGLSSGLFFLILGITGSLLLFRHVLDRALNPDIYHRPDSGLMISADSAYRIVAEASPGFEKIVLHDFPLSSEEPYEFMLYRKTKSPYNNHLSFAFVDSHRGIILRQGNYEDLGGSFIRWIYAMHYSFLLGRIGQAICAIVGILLLLTIVSGLVVYRKYIRKVILFQVPLYKQGRRLYSSLHRVVGVWSALINIVLLITGVWMNIPVFQPLFSDHQTMEQKQASFTAKPNLDKLLDYCKVAAPGFEPIAINIPKDDKSPILVRGHLSSTTFFLFGGKASNFAFDPVHATFMEQFDIEKADFSKKISWAIYQLHIGGFGGYLVKFIYALIGLTPALLALTGTYLWYKRNW